MNTPLKKARKARGLTLAEVANAVGLDTGNLSRLENGKQSASTETAANLARFYSGEVTEMQILYPERFHDDHDEDPESDDVGHHNAEAQG